MEKSILIKSLYIVIVFSCLTSCAALDRVRPQAINVEDKDLSSVNDSLAFFAISISSSNPKLQLHRLRARNLETEEIYVFPFFDNAVIGSSPLTYTSSGNSLNSEVFLDLPKGLYLITQLDFQNFTFNATGPSVVQSLEHKLQLPLLFEVLDTPSYLGKLQVAIAKKGVEEEWPNFHKNMVDSANPYSMGLGPEMDNIMGRVNTLETYGSLSGSLALSMQQVNQKIGGNVAMVISASEPQLIEQVKMKYKALSDKEITVGRMWFAEQNKQ